LNYTSCAFLIPCNRKTQLESSPFRSCLPWGSEKGKTRGFFHLYNSPNLVFSLPQLFPHCNVRLFPSGCGRAPLLWRFDTQIRINSFLVHFSSSTPRSVFSSPEPPFGPCPVTAITEFTFPPLFLICIPPFISLFFSMLLFYHYFHFPTQEFITIFFFLFLTLRFRSLRPSSS